MVGSSGLISVTGSEARMNGGGATSLLSPLVLSPRMPRVLRALARVKESLERHIVCE